MPDKIISKPLLPAAILIKYNDEEWGIARSNPELWLGNTEDQNIIKLKRRKLRSRIKYAPKYFSGLKKVVGSKLAFCMAIKFIIRPLPTQRWSIIPKNFR